MQNQSMSIGQNFIATLQPEDANGEPGTPGIGVPTWASSPTGLTLTPASDGMSCKIDSLNAAPGTYTVTPSGPATNGATITGPFQVTVNQNPATQYAVTFSTPVND